MRYLISNIPKSIILFLLITLSSCGTYTHYSRTITPFTSERYQIPEKPHHVYTFLDGEQLDFRYSKLFLIEIKVDGTEELGATFLDCLKYEAWKRGANGLIHIKQGYLSDVDSYGSHNQSVSTTHQRIYSAVAVNIHEDTPYMYQYSPTLNTNFIANAERVIEKARKDQNRSQVAGVAFLVGITALNVATTIHEINNPEVEQTCR